MAKFDVLERDLRVGAGVKGRAGVQWGLIFGVWGLSVLMAVWRVWLAGVILWHSDLVAMQGAAVVHWRRLDEMLAWVAVGVLVLMRGAVPGDLQEARVGILLGVTGFVGMGLTAMSLMLDQLAVAAALSATAEGGGVMVMGFCGVVLAIREARMAWGAARRGGVTILDLWRFAAGQWGLLMVGSVVYMTFALSKERRVGEEGVRNLIFMVPAAGVLPNAMMAAGIFWWDKILRAGGAVLPVPRMRAWVVAFLLVNVGGVLLVMRGAVGIPGAVLEIAGVLLYVVGFPAGFGRGVGGRTVLAAWGMLVVALGAAGIERVMLMGNPAVSTFYSGAWRHVWGVGVVTLWLMGMGAMAMERLGGTLRGDRLARVAIGLMGAGVVVTTGVWLMTAMQTGAAQVPVMRWVIIGVGLEGLGLLVAGMGILLARMREGAKG